MESISLSVTPTYGGAGGGGADRADPAVGGGGGGGGGGGLCDIGISNRRSLRRPGATHAGAPRPGGGGGGAAGGPLVLAPEVPPKPIGRREEMALGSVGGWRIDCDTGGAAARRSVSPLGIVGPCLTDSLEGGAMASGCWMSAVMDPGHMDLHAPDAIAPALRKAGMPCANRLPSCGAAAIICRASAMLTPLFATPPPPPPRPPPPPPPPPPPTGAPATAGADLSAVMAFLRALPAGGRAMSHLRATRYSGTEEARIMSQHIHSSRQDPAIHTLNLLKQRRGCHLG